MKTYVLAFIVLFAFCSSTTQAQDSRPSQKEALVGVPAFINGTCPIMGKPASSELWVDTPFGRIYICCAPCVKRIRRSPKGAYKAAYPKNEELKHLLCPVSGRKLGKDAVAVSIQGVSFKVCCKKCVAPAKEQAQLSLARVHDESLKDVGNARCPVSGKPVNVNVIVRVGKELVRLEKASCIDAVKEKPRQLLAKAKSIAAVDRRRAQTQKGSGGQRPMIRRIWTPCLLAILLWLPSCRSVPPMPPPTKNHPASAAAPSAKPRPPSLTLDIRLPGERPNHEGSEQVEEVR